MIVSVQNDHDTTWFFSPVIAWTCTEISAAIIALSLPALRAIFGFLKKKRSTGDCSNGTGHGGPPIGLSSVSGKEQGRFEWERKRSRVYDYDETVDTAVECSRSESREILWGGDQKIRVTETVDVD